MNFKKINCYPNLCIIISIVFFVSLFFIPLTANAAELLFAPSSKNIRVGDTINVSVLVSTDLININTAEALIKFPSDLLEVISVSKNDSVFSMWIESPIFSNSNGTINFNGGVPTPGFVGSGGKILNISFKAKKVGTATLSFVSASVLANDGLGTEVFKGSGRANFQIDEALVSPPEKTEPSVNKTVTSTIKKVTNQVEQTLNNIPATLSESIGALSLAVERTNELIQQSSMAMINQSLMQIYIIIIIIFIILLILLFVFYMSHHNRKDLSKLIAGIEKEVQNLKYSNSSKEEELLKIKEFEKTIQQIKIDSAIQGKEVTATKEIIEWKLNEKTTSFEKEIQKLKESVTLMGGEILGIKENLYLKLEEKLKNFTVLFENNFQETVKKHEFTSFKIDIESRLEDKLKEISVLFNTDIQQIKEINTMKDTELLKLKERFENITDLLSKIPQKADISTVEKEFMKIQEDIYTKIEDKLKDKLNEVSVLFNTDIQQIKEINTMKDAELLKLKDRFESITDLLGKLSQKADSNIVEKELLKIQEEMQAKIEEKLVSIKQELSSFEKTKDIEKGLLMLQSKLDMQIKNGLETGFVTVNKEIDNLKQKENDQQKKLSDLNKDIEVKINNKFKDNALLLEEKISNLTKTNNSSEEKMTELEENIKKINDYYQKLESEEQELKQQITRMNTSLKAFYSSTILSMGEAPEKHS